MQRILLALSLLAVQLGMCAGLMPDSTLIAAEAVDPSTLSGIVVDDKDAVLTGTWKPSTHTSPFVGDGYQHDDNTDKGEKSAKYTPDLPKAGNYRVLINYTPGNGRSANVPVTVTGSDGATKLYVDQRTAPANANPVTVPPFVDLGIFKFDAGRSASVVISNEGTKGHVIVDAVRFVATDDAVTPADKLVTKPIEVKPLPNKNPKPSTIVAQATQAPAQPVDPNKPNEAKKPSDAKKSAEPKPALAKKAAAKDPKEAKPVEPAIVNSDPLPVVVRKSRDAFKKLTTVQLDELIEVELAGIPLAASITDEQFLRRATLDLIGRQPSPAEFDRFMNDPSPDKRTQIIDRLLAMEEFGRNWGNYWSDVISHRVQPPELTFLTYQPLKTWLAEQFNSGRTWDQITRDLITAEGKISDNAASTFVGFHQGNPISLAGETSRIFLGVQINCAECHDHPFDHWKQTEFHNFAAFFARSKVKMPQNDCRGCDVTSDPKAEHRMPKAKEISQPTFLAGEAIGPHRTDSQRRTVLADFVTGDNPWFAKAYVNRIWGRLLSRGFYEPVDNVGENQDQQFPKVHAAVSEHFRASGHDIKDLFRLVMNSEAYQRQLPTPEWSAVDDARKKYMAAAKTAKLRGDEVFESLAAATGLPNYTPPKQKAPPGQRFPPPPKSTQDLVNDTFGFDPSLAPDDVSRTLAQSMMLMNNDQLQKQINANDPETLLAKALAEEPDDAKLVDRLFLQALARRPTGRERTIAIEHVKLGESRSVAFEDLLWSLVNSTEFTTKR